MVLSHHLSVQQLTKNGIFGPYLKLLHNCTVKTKGLQYVIATAQIFLSNLTSVCSLYSRISQRTWQPQSGIQLMLSCFCETALRMACPDVGWQILTIFGHARPKTTAKLSGSCLYFPQFVLATDIHKDAFFLLYMYKVICGLYEEMWYWDMHDRIPPQIFKQVSI
jgi:hypothetical protein